MSVTIRVRSLVWFVTGAVLATAVTLMFVNAWRVEARPGDDDATLVPITPCRLLDTRQPGQTPLTSGETRTLDAHGTNGACTIPTDAVALSLNVTAIGATTDGTFLTIWQDGAAQPEASSLNPAPAQPPTPNGVLAPLSPAGKFNVFNFVGNVDVLIDVNAYYTKTNLKQAVSEIDFEFVTAKTVTTGWTQVAEVRGLKSGVSQIVFATFEIREPNDNVEVYCGLSRNVDQPPSSTQTWTWESPDQGDVTPMTLTTSFFNTTQTGVALWCRNESGTSELRDINITVISNNSD